MRSRLELSILPQPDDSTCGPTSLHAVYRYFDDTIPLDQVIGEVRPLETGGTLAVYLACHALRRGYGAIIYTYNLELFDPSWFTAKVDLAGRLRAQAARKTDPRLQTGTEAYLEYLALGGEIRHEELDAELIERHLDRDRPILTGLSATYLYGCKRESGAHEIVSDDIGGYPQGHFVVLCGHDRKGRRVRVADPYHNDPPFDGHDYEVGMDRLIGAILLGVLTYDANLLVLEPPGAPR